MKYKLDERYPEARARTGAGRRCEPVNWKSLYYREARINETLRRKIKELETKTKGVSE